jgi:ABC-type lipoprotein export system ATPase subunit
MIKLVNVSKYYHNEGIVSLGLRKINLEFNIGEFVAITGESGSGKSTLLNVISGIDTYEEGELYINGEETSHFDDDDWEEYRKNTVAFIFQNYNLIDSYTVLRNVEVALVNQGYDFKTRREKAKEILSRVGLHKHFKHRASKLSGGEKQRLAIARALAKDSEIIVADEPTGNLDSESGKQVLALLHEVARDKVVLIVTHNYEQAANYVSRKVRLFDGEVVEDKEVRTFIPQEPEEKIYQKMSELKKSSIISFYNFFGQPKKSILMLLVSLATVLFVFLLYGSLLNVDDYVTTPGVSLEGYGNFYKERMIVIRKDQEPLTDEDYNKLGKNKKIRSIIKEDSVVDINFLLVDDSLKKFSYMGGNLGFLFDYDEANLLGRLPEKEGEILICTYVMEDDILLMKSFLDKEYNFQLSSYRKNYDFNISFNKNYKLVGVYNTPVYPSKFVISEEEIKEVYNYLRCEGGNYELSFKGEKYTGGINFLKVLYDPSLTGNQVKSLQLNDFLINDLSFELFWEDQKLDIIKNDNYDKFNDLYVSPELFEKMVPLVYNQYTLNLYKASDARSVLDFLYDNGYYGFSPNLSGYAYGFGMDYILTKIINFVILGFSIFVIYLLSYLIFKAILNSKVHDYTILRIIGFQKSNIRQIIFLEILTSFIFAYILFSISYQYIRIKYPVMDIYELQDYLFIGLINLFLGVFITLKFIRYQKKRSLFSTLRVEG